MSDFTAPSASRNVNQKINIEHKELQEYLHNWDAEYKEKMSHIDIFDSAVTSQYSNEQLQYFVKIFYHSRGHFKDFLWHLGNYAPSKNIKDIILKNIEEEFNGEHSSHEQMYLDFARKLGVDLTEVIVDEVDYLPEIRKFNKLHIEWLYKQPWDVRFAAFSAYERLDKTDYEALTTLFPDEHIFSKVHREAEHFDRTFNELGAIWSRDPNNVIMAFEFICSTQAEMWQDLSIAITKA
ncbi:MAG: iron-containing redox enzyme family protein [Coxiellaceae bacterium]|nr:iron-containing redox enzyme family protein [Coxiellaceae bacterium]